MGIDRIHQNVRVHEEHLPPPAQLFVQRPAIRYVHKFLAEVICRDLDLFPVGIAFRQKESTKGVGYNFRHAAAFIDSLSFELGDKCVGQNQCGFHNRRMVAEYGGTVNNYRTYGIQLPYVR